MKSELRIANVCYLNSVPYQAITQCDRVIYSECDPAECARRLHEDEADLGLIPITEIASRGLASQKGYSLLPYGITAQSQVKSVFLFSEVPFNKLSQVYIDKSSNTSVILLSVILQELYPDTAPELRFYRTDSKSIENVIAGDSGALVIGDPAMKLAGKYPYQMDLSETWHELQDYLLFLQFGQDILKS